MAGLEDAGITIEVVKGGDRYRNVIVGEIAEYYDWPPVPYSGDRVKVYDIPVELDLLADSCYAMYTKAGTDLQYQYQYTITVTDPSYPEREVEAKTRYSTSPGADETPVFHALTPESTGVQGLGMSGSVRVYELPGQPEVGATLDLVLRERDVSFGGPFKIVPDASQTIYLRGAPTESKFIVRTPRVEHIFYPIEVFKVPWFGFWMPVPLQFPRVLTCDPSPCEFELTEADGFKEGKHYVFQSSLSVAPVIKIVQVVPEEQVYKFEGTTVIDLVPITDLVSETVCGLLGIEPGSEECKLALAEFVDPVYVANVFSKVLFHKDLAGNEGEVDILDYIFVPLALASGVIPVGGVGKKVIGPILKGARKGGIVAKWLEKNKAMLHAASLTDNEIDSAVVLNDIKAAANAVEGSAKQEDLLRSAYIGLETILTDSKLTEAEKALRQGAVVKEVTKKIEDFTPKSKTNAKEVIRKSGLEDAKHVVPGVAKLHPRDTSRFRSILQRLHKKKPLTKEIEGQLCELASYSIKGGEIAENWRPLGTGFLAWLKRHRLAATLISAAVIMFPWWFADNLVFLIYILRYTDVLDKTWGEQWKKAIETVKKEYWNMKEDPCEKAYQANYIEGIDTMRWLLEGANPIPEDKLAKAKYNIEVCYAIRIGDPNEFVKEAAWKTLNSDEQTYTKLVKGCENPLIPAGGLKTVDIPNPKYAAKVERIVDGDTFWVSSNDPDWPYEEDYQVRLLGVDTPDKDKAGYYSVRRKAIPDAKAKEDTILDLTLEDYNRANRAAELLLKKQEVILEIDLENQYDTTEMQRILATVWIDRTEEPAYTGDFGEKQLRDGNARVFFYSPNSLFGPGERAKYLSIEARAKADKVGLWGSSAPSTPKGKIHCKSAPGSAWVYLDDQTAPKGDTEMTLKDVPIGDHEVEFRGTSSCIDCSCDYNVTVKEDETAQAFCELSAVYEVERPFYIDDNGQKETSSLLVDPAIYLDRNLDPGGTVMSPICMHPPCKIVFGRRYTSLEDYTPLEVERCAAAFMTDLNFGERRIEFRQKGFKTMYENIEMKHGKYEIRSAEMVKGDEEDYIKIGGTGPGTLHVTVYDGELTQNLVRADISVRDITGAEQEVIHTDEANITGLETDKNPYTLTVTADGYDIYTREGIRVAKGSTTDITVYLTGTGGEGGGEGTLHVTVRDGRTHNLLRSLISVRDKHGVEQESKTSDDTNIKLLVAGSPYTLYVTHDDYKTGQESGIYIRDNETTDINVDLTRGEGVEGEVEVSLTRPYYIMGDMRTPVGGTIDVYVDSAPSPEVSFGRSDDSVVFYVSKGETHTIKTTASGHRDWSTTMRTNGDVWLMQGGEMPAAMSIAGVTYIDRGKMPETIYATEQTHLPIELVNTGEMSANFLVEVVFTDIETGAEYSFDSDTKYIPKDSEATIEVPIDVPSDAMHADKPITTFYIDSRVWA